MCTFFIAIYLIVTQIYIVLFQIIGDHKRKNGKYEYGCCFYTAGTRNKSAYREGDKWWFVQESEMSCRLNRPRLEKISANRTLYYFDDIPTQLFLLM